MFKKTNNPIAERIVINGKECIRFTFNEVLTSLEAASFVTEWKRSFEEDFDEKVTIIWQCLDMKNDKTEARLIFQNALKDVKDKIETIWLVTDSILIQAEAEIISFFASYKIHLVKSEEELLSQMSVA